MAFLRHELTMTFSLADTWGGYREPQSHRVGGLLPREPWVRVRCLGFTCRRETSRAVRRQTVIWFAVSKEDCDSSVTNNCHRGHLPDTNSAREHAKHLVYFGLFNPQASRCLACVAAWLPLSPCQLRHKTGHRVPLNGMLSAREQVSDSPVSQGTSTQKCDLNFI